MARPDAASRSDIEVRSSDDVHRGMEAVEAGYVVTADIPGFETDDIDLRFEEGVLSIRGELAVNEAGESGWHRRRWHVTAQLATPGDVVEAAIGASSPNGVRTVHLPTETDPVEDGHRIDIDCPRNRAPIDSIGGPSRGAPWPKATPCSTP